MSWASHPTNEMPATLAASGRHRRRRSGLIGIIVVAALVALAAGGALLLPGPLGWRPATPWSASTVADQGVGGPSGRGQPASSSPNVSSTTPPPSMASPEAATVTLSTIAPSTVTPSTVVGETVAVPAAVATIIGAFETEVVRLTNLQRSTHGCTALRADAKLATAARDHSVEMAGLQTLTHTGADGSGPGARIKLAGYNTDQGWAENVAAGYPTPQAVMTVWMNSEGHRNNILNCSLKAIGVGVATASNGRLYWTQDFGGR